MELTMKVSLQQAKVMDDALSFYRALMVFNSTAKHSTVDEKGIANQTIHVIDRLRTNVLDVDDFSGGWVECENTLNL